MAKSRSRSGGATERRAAEAARSMGAQCLGLRVRLLSRAITRIFDDAMRPHGLTGAQFTLLAAVAGQGPVAATDLGALLSMERSTLSRNLRRPLEDDWVVAETDDDGRGQRLRIGRTGAALLLAARPAWEGAQAEAEELLGRAGASALQRLGTRLLGDADARG